MSASSRVFGIPELLDNILQHPQAQDLLSHQQVNKLWHDIIRSSYSMQRKLYYNIELFREGDSLWSVEYNPFMYRFFREDSDSINHCCRTIDPEAFRIFDYPTASWKNMHVTVPSKTSLVLWEENGKQWEITSATGVTFGELANVQQKNDEVRAALLRKGNSVRTCFWRRLGVRSLIVCWLSC